MKWNTYAQIWKCMDYYNCVQLKTEPHLNNREHEHPLVLYKKLTCLQEVCYICVLEFQILWQSLVEIEDHYFDRIATFEAPYYGTYIKDGGHTLLMDSLDISTSMNHVWAPPLTEVQWYSASSLVMQSKYVTDWPSIFTWDYRIYVYSTLGYLIVVAHTVEKIQ